MAKSELSEEAAEKVRRALMRDGDISALLCSKEQLAEMAETALAEDKAAILSKSSSQLADFLSDISVEASRAIALGRQEFLADLRKDILDRVLLWHKARQEEAQKKRKTIVGTLAKKIQSHLEEGCGDELSGINEAELEKKILAAIAAGMSAGAPKQKAESETKVSAPQKNGREVIIADWRTFYQKWFKIDADFSNVEIPEAKDSRPVLLPKGFGLKQFFEGQKAIKDKTMQNIGRFAGLRHYRLSHGNAYAVCFPIKNGKLAHLSVKRVMDERRQGATVLEWLVYNLKFFDETGKFLNYGAWCMGSVNSYSPGDPGDPRIVFIRISGSGNLFTDLKRKSAVMNGRACVVMTTGQKEFTKKKKSGKKAKADVPPPAAAAPVTYTF